MICPVVELTDVAGLGPAKAEKLKAAGITSVTELAQIDLRRPLDIGIRRETIKKFKEDARKLLKSEGIEFEKAAYGSGGSKAKPAAKSAAKPVKAAPKAEAKPVAKPAVRVVESKGASETATVVEAVAEEEPKRGFFKRLLRL